MTKSSKLLIILSMIFFATGVLLFARAIQKYQVLTSSQAEEPIVRQIQFQLDQTYGPLDQEFGIVASDITSTTEFQNIQTLFPNKGIYIKLISPSVSVIQHTNFTTLQEAGYHWYFSFPDYGTMTTFLQAFSASYPDAIAVAELTNYDNFDQAQTETLVTSFPNIKFHAAEHTYWPRDKVKATLEKVQFPIINAVSFKIVMNNESVFQHIKTMFATMFDASADWHGGTNITINYPPNTLLSLSNIEFAGNIAQNVTKRMGIISGALINYVQFQGKSGKAPIKYLIAGNLSAMSTVEKTSLAFFRQMQGANSAILWPAAVDSNGDPWGAPAAGDPTPLVGIIVMKNNVIQGVLTNTHTAEQTAQLPTMDWSGYKTYSSVDGAGDKITDQNQIVLQPNESVFILQSDVPIPTPTGVDLSGVLECDPGLDPYESDTIRATNGTDQSIGTISVDVHRCAYEPGIVEQYRGSFKCEGPGDCDPGEEACREGVWDEAYSQNLRNIVIAPGEQRTYTVQANDCEIVQLDIRNDIDDTAQRECHNVQSQDTVQPGTQWPGGIAFAISQNATGYDATTGTCPQPTATPTATPTQTPTATPTGSPTATPTNTPSPTPTATPTPSPTHTPSPTPTNTPAPTNTPTPTPTNTPVPTNTPTPIPTNTPTPVQQLTVEDQPPGITPWMILLIPAGLVLLGLLL